MSSDVAVLSNGLDRKIKRDQGEYEMMLHHKGKKSSLKVRRHCKQEGCRRDRDSEMMRRHMTGKSEEKIQVDYNVCKTRQKYLGKGFSFALPSSFLHLPIQPQGKRIQSSAHQFSHHHQRRGR